MAQLLPLITTVGSRGPTWRVVDLVLKVHHLGELVDEVDAVAAVVGHPSLVVQLLVDIGRLLLKKVLQFNPTSSVS